MKVFSFLPSDAVLKPLPLTSNLLCQKQIRQDPNKAFHLIQAFAPGEVSYKEAHQIGVELANKLLEGKFSYIVSTHIDKGHVHNHIIFCAADNVNHEKIS